MRRAKYGEASGWPDPAWIKVCGGYQVAISAGRVANDPDCGACHRVTCRILTLR